MATREDPFRGSRFLLEIDGITLAGFSEVTIPDSSADPIEFREGNEGPTVRKIPGLVKYSNISLKRGITTSTELFEWYKQVIDGKFKKIRRNISIILLDELGSEANRWNFVGAWPRAREYLES
jgi:phage tail-like protein